MRVHLLSLASLLVVAVCLATSLDPWYQSWEGSRTKAETVLEVALGDSRQLFARHFFAKADAYFHNGYYPTIYDNREGFENAHISEDRHEEGEAGEEEEAKDFLGKPKDWIDAFGRHFFPARHTHLGDGGCGSSCCQRKSTDSNGAEGAAAPDPDHNHDHEGEVSASAPVVDEREILPWLKLSLELDPKRIETYAVASFWLRKTAGKPDEAERVLREGLRKNPGEPELLLELGQIYAKGRNDHVRARNVWELGVKNWREREGVKKEPNLFVYAQLLSNLANVEESDHHPAKAVEYLTELLRFSPNKDSIQKWIARLQPGAEAGPEGPAAR